MSLATASGSWIAELPHNCFRALLGWLHMDGSHLCVLKGRFCQKQMPQYRAVCKKPSAALSETLPSACGFPDWCRAFLAWTSPSTLRTPGSKLSIHASGTDTCRDLSGCPAL
ncbi:TPA: hypothetical protein ACH3X3_007535 [Trebouxia sp. C0006]